MLISATGIAELDQCVADQCVADQCGAAAQRGYTLVEILVVLVIVAILSGLMIIRVGSFGARPAAAQLDSMASLLAGWCEQAIFQNRDLGLRITADGYDFWQPDYSQSEITWRPVSSNSNFQSQPWQGTPRISLLVQGRPAALDVKLPQLRCFAASQMLPFTLRLEATDSSATLSADSSGKLQLQQ